MYVVEILTSRC